jgi:outer membrane protein assembly factor BamB
LALDKGESVTRLHLLDGTLYCLTSRNRLMAVDAARGLWRWTLPVAGVDDRVFCLLHVDGFVVPNYLARGFPDRPGLEVTGTDKPFDALLLNTFTYVLVVDRATGKPAMKVPLNFAATTGGAVAEDAFGRHLYYVASADDRCHALDLSRALDLWSAEMGAAVRVAPVVYGGVLFVADADGLLRAGLAEPIDPRPLWNSSQVDSQPMHGAVTAGLHVDERGCFVPCEDNRLYAFDRQSGKPLWPPVVCQGPLRLPPQVSDNTIFQYALRDRLYAVDVATGVVRWAMPAGRVVVGIVQDRGSQVYVLDASGHLRVVEEISGQELASVPITAYDVYLPNVTAPAIYATSRTGELVCIRPLAAGSLTVEMLRGRP